MSKQLGSVLEMPQVGTPSGNPATNYTMLYFKADGKLYGKNSAGAETLIGPDTAGASAPVAHGQYTTASTPALTTNTWTTRAGWTATDTADTTTTGGTIGVSGTGQFQVTAAGWYYVSYTVTIATSATACRRLGRILVNGTDDYATAEASAPVSGAQSRTSPSGSIVIYLRANDTVEIQGWHNLGSDLAWDGGQPGGNTFTVCSIGPGQTGPTGATGPAGGTVLYTLRTPGVTLTNPTTDTTMFTVPAQAAGTLDATKTVYRLRAFGTIDAIATSGIFNGRIRANGTIIHTSSLCVSQTGAATNLSWSWDMDLYVDATGSGGSMSALGQVWRVGTAAGVVSAAAQQTYATAVDLSGGLTISTTVQNTTGGGNIVRCLRATVEKIST